MGNWFVQIFAVTDARAQELIVGLLSGVRDVVVEPAISGSERFVVTECGDAFQAQSVARIVMSIDYDARLTHSTTGPREALTA